MQCTGVKNIISLTKAEYDALANKDSETIYVVEEYAHDYVDLGLRDGNGQKILFATCNIGASAPQEYGDYFAWGETSKRYISIGGNSVVGGSFEWSNCPYHTGSTYKTDWSKYIPTGKESYSESGVADNKLTLESGDDAASAIWGGGWRMPDKSDLEYLIGSNVTSTWTNDYNGTGVAGLLITGKGSFSSASLFLPAAGRCVNTALDDAGNYGYYWSRSVYSDVPCNAWSLYFKDGDQYMYNLSRYIGLSVRPVHVGDVVPSYKLYKGSVLINKAYDDEINALAEISDWAEALPWNEDAEWNSYRENPVQSDWNETDTESLAYIKNKPAESPFVSGTGNYSAENKNNSVRATGNGAFAFGMNDGAPSVIASGVGSMAHGLAFGDIIASGPGSHAEGVWSVASGYGSHAEGYNVSALGNYSHAEGDGNIASAGCSHAEGLSTTASGGWSHAEGFGTTTSNDYEHAQGMYNVSHTGATASAATLHSVGVGTYGARVNAFEIMKNGDVYVKGIGGYDGTNPNTSGVKTLAGMFVVVEGTLNGTTFAPSDPSLPFSEFLSVFENGGSVTLKVASDSETTAFKVIKSYNDGGLNTSMIAYDPIYNRTIRWDTNGF